MDPIDDFLNPQDMDYHIRLISLALLSAIRLKASKVTFSPEEDEVRVFYDEQGGEESLDWEEYQGVRSKLEVMALMEEGQGEFSVDCESINRNLHFYVRSTLGQYGQGLEISIQDLPRRLDFPKVKRTGRTSRIIRELERVMSIISQSYAPAST